MIFGQGERLAHQGGLLHGVRQSQQYSVATVLVASCLHSPGLC